MDYLAIGKGHRSTDGINLTNAKAPILLHVFGEGKQIVIYTRQPRFPVDGLVVANFKFQTGHRRLFGGNYDAFQK